MQVRLQGKKVVAIAAGRFHAIALVESDEVWGWGCNAGHQLGDGTRFDRATSVQVSLPPQKFVAIANPPRSAFGWQLRTERKRRVLDMQATPAHALPFGHLYEALT